MIECIFTIDYEIYGNGEGSLKELVYEPAEHLREIFLRRNARFVTFVEVAELELIEAQSSDTAIDLVKQQLKDFYRDGFELELHLHPQWYKARYEAGKWLLDYSEYNLCTLSKDRIIQIVDRSINYFRELLDKPDYKPFAFRAGNWLFQPAQTVANVLSDRGIKVDSSVFKGGLQNQLNLDYRPALKNGYYWRFQDDASLPDPEGDMLEIPIYSQMVPAWKMLTTKRIGFRQKGVLSDQTPKNHSFPKRLNRLVDFARFRYPLKFDFCRMTINELTMMVDTAIKEDKQNPASFKPLVAIGHTKDLVDLETVEFLLSYLKKRGIAITTLDEAYNKCRQ